MERTRVDPTYAADALHVLFRSRMPGASGPPEPEDAEAFDELEYAGELMCVQFLSLVRTALQPKKKGGD